MNLPGEIPDPLDIVSSFLSIQRSETTYDFNLDEIDRIIKTAATPVNKQPPESKDEYKTYLYEMVKKNTVAARQFHGWLKKGLLSYIDSAVDIPDRDKQRASFWAGQMISAWSPSNFFWTNLSAVKRFLDSDGKSLFHGMENWLSALTNPDDLVKISDPTAYRLGENLAYTPGKVVFKNDLVELIQYKASTKKTYAIPIVLIQPWINKYYIFDLTRKNSLVRYLRDQGFTVFITSWKNPGTQMRGIDFENYMLDGALQSIEAAKDICGVKQVHAAGYCIGGTLVAALMAWLNRGFVPKRSLPVAHWSVFSTMVDFSNPGILGVFITPNILKTIESFMQGPGYLDKNCIGRVFRMLKPDSLIWQYYAHNFLQGGDLPQSDVLFWNSDNTNLPEKMMSTYLKDFYLENKLCQPDELQLGKRKIDLGRIGQPLYAVGALKDHISPWKETFKIGWLVKGETRYVISTDGHIAGIVNPPTKQNRRKYRTGHVSSLDDPDTWFENQEIFKGSWWPDWVDWLSNQCGPLVPAPNLGSLNYPVLYNAPGTYATER